MNLVATFLSYYMMLVPKCSQILAFRCNLHLNLPSHAPTSNVEKPSVVSALGDEAHNSARNSGRSWERRPIF